MDDTPFEWKDIYETAILEKGAGSTNTGQALIDEIMVQRRVELWGEGFRFYDLKRLDLPLDRTAVPNYVSASVGGVMQVAAGDNKWQFAIPIGELQANPQSSQND